MLTKFLSRFAILLLIFSTNLIALDEDEEPIETTHLNRTQKKEKEFCSHWGLSHWFYGISEYFQRCLCCGFDDSRREGANITLSSNSRTDIPEHEKHLGGAYRIESTSDCLFVDQEDGLCDNPVTGTLFCPLMALGHICCLPFALCEPSKNQYTKGFKRSSSYGYYSPPRNDPVPDYRAAEDERKRQEHQAGAMWAQQQQANASREADRVRVENEHRAFQQRQIQEQENYRRQQQLIAEQRLREAQQAIAKANNR